MKITLITETEKLLSLRGIWESAVSGCAVPSLFLTLPWFLAWWSNRGGDWGLSVLLIEDETHGNVGIVPLMRRGDRVAFLADQDVTDYCDCLFPAGSEPRFLRALLEYLSEITPAVRVIKLINIPGASPTLALLPELAREFGWTCEAAKSEDVLVLDLPDSYEEYLARLPRKYRHELRRKIRKTEALTGLRFLTVDRSEDVGSAMSSFIELHRAVSPEKERFWRGPGMPGFFRDAAAGLASEGRAALHFLYSGERPAAALIAGTYGDTVYFYNIAYAREFAASSPGYYLFDRALRLAVQEGKARADFLRGAERYKFEFGAQIGTIYNLILNRIDNPT